MEQAEREAFDAELISEPAPVARATAAPPGSMLPSEAGKDHAAGVAAMMALMGMPHG